MNLRKIIRENIEQMVDSHLNDNELMKIDGFEFVNKKTDDKKNLIWKYSKSIKSGSSNREDSDYIFNIFIAYTPNKNWYYKIFVYWKTHTSQLTSGKGKDFDLQFGSFNTLEELQKDLYYNLNHNILFSFNNYKDNNKIQLDDEVFKMIEKVSKVKEELNLCKDPYFDDLKKEFINLNKSKSEAQEYINNSYPDEDDKQQLLLILSKIDTLHNRTKIESINSLF
jgi:hypothetical protein